MVRQAKRILRNRAAADADAARTAADFAVAMGEPTPLPRMSRRRIPTRRLLAEAAMPPLPSQPRPQGLTIEEIDLAAPCSKSPRSITCSICLDDIDEGAQQRELPCFHSFHPECIRLWVSRANRCPQCQAEVRPAGKVDSMNSQTGEGVSGEESVATLRARAEATFQILRDFLLMSFSTSQGTNGDQTRADLQPQERQRQVQV